MEALIAIEAISFYAAFKIFSFDGERITFF